MIGRQERLLAVENRWMRAGGVIEAVDLAGGKRVLDDALECRVRVGVEIGERGGYETLPDRRCSVSSWKVN
jgi:hypothetical protein